MARPKKKVLSREELTEEADIQLRMNTRDTLKKFWISVQSGLEKNDKYAIELVSRIFQYDKGPGGVTIFNQSLQLNGVADNQAARVRSFDQIIGKLEERDRIGAGAMISAPVENSEADEDDDGVEDAETEDVQAE